MEKLVEISCETCNGKGCMEEKKCDYCPCNRDMDAQLPCGLQNCWFSDMVCRNNNHLYWEAK